MSDLKVDSSELVATGNSLRYLAGELRDAGQTVQDSLAAIGHAELAHQLDDMQGTWDDRRNALVSKIESVADVAKQAGETFQDIEDNLVAALEGKK